MIADFIQYLMLFNHLLLHSMVWNIHKKLVHVIIYIMVNSLFLISLSPSASLVTEKL